MAEVLGDLEYLAKAIRDEVYKTYYDFKTTVFLCGASTSSPESVRVKIDKLLQEWRSFRYKYDVVYPESLFDELLFGPKHRDLLALENMLADSVDAIVLVVESYGAAAELGAFASNDRLRSKLVCVMDGKFKRSKSFINYGPLRLLKDTGQGEIINGNYSKVKDMIKPIRKAIANVKKLTSKSARVNNVLQAHHYILPCIFLFETVSRDLLIDMVMYASETDEATANAITTAALSILRKNKEVLLTSHGYRLTEGGQLHFMTLGKRGRSKTTYDLGTLDRLRVAVLNCQCREKRLTFKVKK